MNNLKQLFEDYRLVVKNYSYMLAYQLLTLILPIITIPYVTRVLSEDIVGLNSVLQANCSYFVLLGMLGINLLGPREIAKCLGNYSKISRVFSSIYIIQFGSHLLAILCYLIINAFNTISGLKYFYLFQLISSMFDISWLYVGLEDFKSVSIRNFFVKTISFICLFIFVKSDSDVYAYVLTLYVPQIVINIYMWINAINKHVITKSKIVFDKKMLKEASSLFLPQIATNVYTVLDKTIIGIFSTLAVAAYYTQGQALLRLILSIVPTFCKVMSPRISTLIEQNDQMEINKNMKMSSDIIGFFSFMLMFGVLGCSDLFVSWYLPKEYYLTADVMKICAPIIIMVSGANLISIEFLIPKGEQSVYTKSIYFATIINLILNLSLVKPFGIYGICIGSLAAETIGFIIQLIYVKKYFKLRWLFNKCPYYIFAGLIEYAFISVLTKYANPTLVWNFLTIVLAILVYSVVVWLLFKIIKFKNNVINVG